MRSEAVIRIQLENAYIELKRIEKGVNVGMGALRRQQGYIDGLRYALGDE